MAGASASIFTYFENKIKTKKGRRPRSKINAVTSLSNARCFVKLHHGYIIVQYCTRADNVFFIMAPCLQ